MPTESLSADTLVTEGPAKPTPRRRRPRSKAAGWIPRLCDPCNIGSHHLCIGVSCYGCPREHHPRRPGVSGLSDGLAGGTT